MLSRLGCKYIYVGHFGHLCYVGFDAIVDNPVKVEFMHVSVHVEPVSVRAFLMTNFAIEFVHYFFVHSLIQVANIGGVV